MCCWSLTAICDWSANQVCWPAQKEMEKLLESAIGESGFRLRRAHPYKSADKHGFIASQREGMDVFSTLDPNAPLIVAEAVWQYSHHLLHGLATHKGPILTVANWSGTWPGLVGMLNLNGSLTKAGIKYSTLWSEDFQDRPFRTKTEPVVAVRQSPTSNRSRGHPCPRSASRRTSVRVGKTLAEQMQQQQGDHGRL